MPEFMYTAEELRIFADLRKIGLRHPGMVPARIMATAKAVAEYVAQPPEMRQRRLAAPSTLTQTQAASKRWQQLGLNKIKPPSPAYGGPP